MTVNHVKGEDRGKLMLYGLSTCVWCKKTKTFLQEMNVGFEYMDVDLLAKDQRSATLDEIRKWNPACTFPSLIIDDSQCIVGYDEKKMKEALKL